MNTFTMIYSGKKLVSFGKELGGMLKKDVSNVWSKVKGGFKKFSLRGNNGGFVNLGVFGKSVSGSVKVIEGTSYDINKLKKTQPYTYPEIVESMKQSILKEGYSAVPPIEV